MVIYSYSAAGMHERASELLKKQCSQQSQQLTQPLWTPGLSRTRSCHAYATCAAPWGRYSALACCRSVWQKPHVVADREQCWVVIWDCWGTTAEN